MSHLEFLALIVVGLAIWWLAPFFWVRFVFLATLFTLWGLVATVVPLFLAIDALADGRYGTSVMTLLVCAIPALLWVAVAIYARDWLQRENAAGRLFQPWNSRD